MNGSKPRNLARDIRDGKEGEAMVTPVVVLDTGGWISGSALEIPRPKCGRCEDWTTVVHETNVISPCPACRRSEYEAWLAAVGRVPAP